MRVCFAFNFSVYVSLQRPSASGGTTGNQPPCFTSGIDIGPDTEFFCKLHVAQEDSGARQRSFYLKTEHSTALFLRQPAGVLDHHLSLVCTPQLPWLQLKEDSMQLAVKRFARFHICAHLWKNKINKIAKPHFGYPDAKLMHMSSAVKVLIYNWENILTGTRTPPEPQ